jgi:hypothetical protein
MTSESQNNTHEQKNATADLRGTLPAITLRTLATIIAPIAKEARFRIDPAAEVTLHCEVVDAAHVSLVAVNVRRMVFQTLEGSAVDVILDVEELREATRVLDAKDSAQFEVRDGKLTIEQGGFRRGLTLAKPDSVITPKVPRLELPAFVTVDVASLAKAVKALKAGSNHVAFRIRDGKFVVSTAAGSWISDANATGAGVSLFSVDYLQGILGAIKKGSKEARIELGTDYPVAISANAAGVNARYLLAPRIDDSPSSTAPSTSDEGAEPQGAVPQATPIEIAPGPIAAQSTGQDASAVTATTPWNPRGPLGPDGSAGEVAA